MKNRARGCLAVCLLLSCGISTGSVCAQQNADDLPRRAESVLRTHCYPCHGKLGRNEGGLNFVLRTEKLTAGGKFIVPGEPDRSYLLQRIEEDEMPPPGKRAPLQEAEKGVLRA